MSAAGAIGAVRAAPVPSSTRDLLPGADVADAYALTLPGEPPDATAATRRMLERIPRWIAGLMALRDALVAPFGLRTRFDPSLARRQRIGPFPVLSADARRVVLGFDDRHLDFRLVLDSARGESGASELTATTLVRRHGLAGRIYLGIVMPFHRRIVPALLRQAREAEPALPETC